MKRRIKVSLVAMLLLLATVLSLPFGIYADDTTEDEPVTEEGEEGEEEEEDKPLPMAYNIYAYPQFEGELAFDTYMIEMCSDMDIDCTYWSLANFRMYISDETKEEYRDIRSSGAYAGMQHAGGYKKAIMSFWEWHYWPNGISSGEEETNLVAENIYPGGGVFGGEGEGTNCIRPYNWQGGQWYRMILHTWDDPEKGTTHCGQWIQNVTTGEYTLISYFDTKMRNSYLTGDMMFFMENFYGINADEERDVKLKNTYYKPHGEDRWVSVDTFALKHCNNWANNKIGDHSFGATEEYFWGKAGGYVDPDKQEELDDSQPRQVFTIKQPDQPVIGTPKIREIRLRYRENKDEHYFNWYPETDSTPMFSYKVEVTDVNDQVLFTEEKIRPEMVFCIMDGVKTDAYKIKLSITDIFGGSTYYVTATDAYLAQKPDTLIGAEGNMHTAQISPAPQTPSGGDDASANSNTILIICVAVGAVALIGAVVCVVMLGKKKKKA